MSTALATVKASGAVGRDRKRMEAAAFQASLRANGTSPACDSMVATLYEKEEVMRRARVALGVQCGMLGVGQLKERLASRGRRDLAARFATLNGTRKLVAHPGSLAAEIEEALMGPLLGDASDSDGSATAGEASLLTAQSPDVAELSFRELEPEHTLHEQAAILDTRGRRTCQPHRGLGGKD